MRTMKYTDSDDNDYELRPETEPYQKGDRACKGCAFLFGNSRACREAPTCTPEGKPREMYGVMFRWVLTKHLLDKKEEKQRRYNG
jgi:hypothetical protein